MVQVGLVGQGRPDKNHKVNLDSDFIFWPKMTDSIDVNSFD